MRVSAPEPVGPFGVLLEIATDTGWTQQDERPEQALCSPGVWCAVCVRVCVGSLQQALCGGSRPGPVPSEGAG